MCMCVCVCVCLCACLPACGCESVEGAGGERRAAFLPAQPVAGASVLRGRGYPLQTAAVSGVAVPAGEELMPAPLTGTRRRCRAAGARAPSRRTLRPAPGAVVASRREGAAEGMVGERVLLSVLPLFQVYFCGGFNKNSGR